MSPLLQTQLFNSQSSETQSWSSVVSLSNQQRLLPVSGISISSENMSQTSIGSLTDQKNNLVNYIYIFYFFFFNFNLVILKFFKIFSSVASTSTVNTSVNIPQHEQRNLIFQEQQQRSLFNVDADKIPEITTASKNCMMQIGTSTSYNDSSLKNIQTHLQQPSNLSIVQGVPSKSDCLQQQIMTGIVHCSQQNTTQHNLVDNSNFKAQLQSVGMMSQQSNESFQHMQQTQSSGKMLIENSSQQSIMQGRIFGTGANSNVKNIVGVGGIGTSGGLGLIKN